jgi:hypothetical protein
MGTLKENIQHEVCLLEYKSLEDSFRVSRKDKRKNMATIRTTTNTYKEHNVTYPNPNKSSRLIPQQLDERREKGVQQSLL